MSGAGLLLAAALASRPAAAAQAPASSSATVSGSLRVGGLTRTWTLHRPPGLEPGRKVPLVLVFHGGWGDGKGAAKMTRFDALADREGFLVAYPDGWRRAWNAGECCGPPKRRRVDDPAFVAALLDRLAAEEPIDPGRVYATGMSNGAMFSYRLACELADRVAAVAPVAGTIQAADCRPSRPVPVLHVHGTADARAPFAGGPAGGDALAAARTDRSVADTVALWRRLDACEGRGLETYRRGAAACTAYGPCRGGVEVVSCVIAGGSHSWPGGPPLWVRVLGEPSRDLDATAVIWEFFRRFSLP